MASPVKVTTDKMKEVAEALALLARKQVLIGIPSQNTGRNEGPLNNAEIGYIHENGAPEVNIPARPHLVPGVEKVQDEAISRLKDAGHDALSGNPEAVEKNFHAIGLLGVSSVRNEIRDADFEPLKAATLANRRRKGRTGKKPLIDTGQYIKAQTYVIRDKEK